MELVVWREGLECSTLTNGDSSVFLGVTKAAIREADEPRSDCRGRLVPSHASITVPEYVVFATVGVNLEVWVVGPGRAVATRRGSQRDPL